MPGFTPLLTDRLVVRRFRHDDVAAFAAYRDDPVIARYQAWDLPFTLERAKGFVAAVADDEPGRPGEWFQFAVAVGDDPPIGDIGLRTGTNGRLGEIGFTFARDHWGLGYATEALEAVIGYAFGVLGMHRIEASTDVRNARAIALLERLGMRREGHLVESEWFKGEWTSSYRYAVLAREWRVAGHIGGHADPPAD